MRRILREYVHDQRGTKAIASGLNKDAVPGPATRPWSPDSVSRVLRNRAFVGDLWHQDRWHPGAHEALVDVDLFEQAQSIADARTDSRAAAMRRGDFVLTGTITCVRCDGSYTGTSGTSRNGTAHRYYACQANKRYGAAGCDAPTLPAEEVEMLVTQALLECYSDSALFTQAIEAHLAAHAERRDPLTEQLLAANTAPESKERVRQKYQDDYEAGRLSAERYEGRAAELDREIATMSARVTELELSLDLGDLPVVPTAADLEAMHERLTEGVRSGDVMVRKALFTALIERMNVHAADDIRPTFRLYDPAATSLLDGESSSEVPGQRPGQPGDGLRFASRRPGWTWPSGWSSVVWQATGTAAAPAVTHVLTDVAGWFLR